MRFRHVFTRRMSTLTAVACCAALVLLSTGCTSVSKLRKEGDVAGLVKIAQKSGQDYTKVTGAVDAIGEIGTPEAVKVLIGWVSGDDDSLRTAAIPALGETGDPAGAEPLAAELAQLDPSDTTGYPIELDALVRALGGIRDPRSTQALLGQLDAGGIPVDRAAALGEALAAQDSEVIPGILERITSGKPEVFMPCGIALYELYEENTARVTVLLRTKDVQRIWAGVLNAGTESNYQSDLAYALDNYNDKGLASAMLNSELPGLEQAARAWAGRNGYQVEEIMKFGATP